MPTSNKPLYNQLVDLLKNKIDSQMKPGDMLASERELTAMYGVSRTTVRLALRELQSDGYIYKKHGKGTFVADRALASTNLSDTYSFAEQMKEMGREPKTHILSFRSIEADKYLALNMGLSLGDMLYEIKRLRCADGTPLMVERTYIPQSKFIGLTSSHLEEKPLYKIMEQDYNIHITLAEEEFRASIAGIDDAKLLDIAEASAVLNLKRTTYASTNEIIEFTKSVARADQFVYKVSHVRK